MNEATTMEIERLMRLQKTRAGRLKRLTKNKTSVKKAKSLLSVREKISRHKGLLFAALLLDFTFGLIPFVCVAVNTAFGFYLFFRFGRKKFLATGLTAGLSTALDAIMGVLPVNFGAALVRVLMSEK